MLFFIKIINTKISFTNFLKAYTNLILNDRIEHKVIKKFLFLILSDNIKMRLFIINNKLQIKDSIYKNIPYILNILIYLKKKKITLFLNNKKEKSVNYYIKKTRKKQIYENQNFFVNRIQAIKKYMKNVKKRRRRYAFLMSDNFFVESYIFIRFSLSNINFKNIDMNYFDTSHVNEYINLMEDIQQYISTFFSYTKKRRRLTLTYPIDFSSSWLILRENPDFQDDDDSSTLFERIAFGSPADYEQKSNRIFGYHLYIPDLFNIYFYELYFWHGTKWRKYLINQEEEENLDDDLPIFYEKWSKNYKDYHAMKNIVYCLGKIKQDEKAFGHSMMGLLHPSTNKILNNIEAKTLSYTYFLEKILYFFLLQDNINKRKNNNNIFFKILLKNKANKNFNYILSYTAGFKTVSYNRYLRKQFVTRISSLFNN